MVSAYFNGETNCYRTLSKITNVSPEEVSVTTCEIGKFGSMTSCSNFQVVAYFPGGSVNYPCFGLVSGGSNQRSMPSGITPEDIKNEDFSVFPNPVADKTLVNYSVSDNSEVSIDLYDLLGQHVISYHPDAQLAGTYQQEVDFTSLNVKNGVYYISTTVDGTVHKQKIVYTH